MSKLCSFCQLESEKIEIDRDINRDITRVNCPKCGESIFTGQAAHELHHDLTHDELVLVCSWVRERKIQKRSTPFIMSSKYARKTEEESFFRVSEIIDAYAPKTIGDRIDRILLNLAVMSQEPGKLVEIRENDLFVYYSSSGEQRNYYLDAMVQKSWVQIGGDSVKLTPDGWNRVSELEHTSLTSKQVFVAMSFAPELNHAWENGFYQGVKDAGLSAIRVDKKEHNEKICDVIIAEIKKSCLVIADVTNHRQNVYFEAGYAKGRNIPVIWSCREDHLDDCKFDNRQYSHVVWINPEDLRKRIKNRIDATLK